MKLLEPLCFDSLDEAILTETIIGAGPTTVIPAFDQFVLAALVLIVFVGGMRSLYGAWPWEANKTWYRTRDAVHYLEALRVEKSRNPTERLGETKETTRVVQLVQDVADTNSDNFDRALISGYSASEATLQTKEFRALLRRAKRRWLNSPNPVARN
jgi:hypothetical protein